MQGSVALKQKSCQNFLVVPQLPSLDRGTKMTQDKLPTPKEQRSMIHATFFGYDDDDDDDGERFIALIDHCGIDLAACRGDVKQIPNVILAHYRIGRGRYDLDRVARDLLSYPPIAARIEELEAEKRRARKD
jgi:hypothetical protein